ncbi:MAG: flagellar hook capping FlgD N-terminal domain-containing protein [Thermoguttaceae bacterium]|jgi:flagellar basal-body rod modification protein FlgD
MSTSPVNSTTSAASATSSTAQDPFSSLGVQDFINMLVSELQNQDPMNPISNGEILQETSQIGAIESQDKLNTTLNSVLLGQNVTTANSLINQTIVGTDASGNSVTGQVNSVSIANGTATLNVGTSQVPLGNVTEILPAGSGQTTSNTGS